MAKWRGSYSEGFLEEHQGAFRWLMLLLGVGFVVRFVLDGLGLWPWR